MSKPVLEHSEQFTVPANFALTEHDEWTGSEVYEGFDPHGQQIYTRVYARRIDVPTYDDSERTVVSLSGHASFDGLHLPVDHPLESLPGMVTIDEELAAADFPEGDDKATADRRFLIAYACSNRALARLTQVRYLSTQLPEQPDVETRAQVTVNPS